MRKENWRVTLKRVVKKRIEEKQGQKKGISISNPIIQRVIKKPTINEEPKTTLISNSINERNKLRLFGTSVTDNTKNVVIKSDNNSEKLKCVILGKNADISPFNIVIKMVMELYGNDDNYNNSILVFAYNRGESIAEFRKSNPNKKIIVYQFEQVYNNLSYWYNPKSNLPYIIKRTQHVSDWLRNADEIWEYDLNNLIFLRKIGINKNIKHMPLKYAESLKVIKNNVNKDIDVLFYGELNDRRKKILNKLKENYNVVVLTSMFGDKLYDYIGRSKIVLNLHFYDGYIQEQVRIFELLINNVCVLSEYSKINYFENLIVECDTEKIGEKIKFLLKNNKWQEYSNISDKFQYFNGFEDRSVMIKDNFKHSHYSDNPLFNIIIRTSGRPNYFKSCIASIREQTYKNYNIIVGVDDEESAKYVMKHNNCSLIQYDFSDLNIEKKRDYKNYGRPFVYNLYINELQKYVKCGYILYIDDDDKLNDKNALLKISKKIKEGSDLIMYRAQFPSGRIVPSDENFYKYPVANDMSTLCFCFNSVIKPQWEAYKLGDYRVATYLYKHFKKISYINETLTSLQRSTDGGFGIRDDVK
jgi:hypothetical protein